MNTKSGSQGKFLDHLLIFMSYILLMRKLLIVLFQRDINNRIKLADLSEYFRLTLGVENLRQKVVHLVFMGGDMKVPRGTFSARL